MKKINPLVSCLILNWNRKEETCRAIKSVIEQSYKNIEIVLIDNGSTDGSAAYIKEKFPKIQHIELQKNYGCPGGRNRGLTHCNGEFIFFCDNDGVLHEKAIENAVEIIGNNNDIYIVTGHVKDFKNAEEIDTKYILNKNVFTQTNLFQGGVSLHRKLIYTEIDKYPDDYMYGGEETYLSYRILDKDFKIMKSNQVILWHKKSILARDNSKETINKWSNTLLNAYQLFPIENFILFYFYFHTVYFYYAWKMNLTKYFLRSLFSLNRRFKKYERIPVSRKSYKKFKQLNK